MPYRRLTQKIERAGPGLHSGREFRLSIEPFDGPLSLEAGEFRAPVSSLALDGTARGSDLIFPDGSRVRTCEHVLSALAGLGVWQAKLKISGERPFEMPGLDGCALGLASEITEKSVPCDGQAPLTLKYPLRVGDDTRFIAAFPSEEFRITYVIDYEAEAIGTQILDYGGAMSYLKEIAPARTFVMRTEIEALRKVGLALGGSLDNAIAVDGANAETAGGLRYPDEFVRHKVLDLLGDLACLARPLTAHVVAVRSGHAQHLQLADRLKRF